jgi:hypothetical protein
VNAPNATAAAPRDGHTSHAVGSRNGDLTAHDRAVLRIVDALDATVIVERVRARVQKACNECGASLEGMRRHALYCSPTCRRKACRKRAANAEHLMA